MAGSVEEILLSGSVAQIGGLLRGGQISVSEMVAWYSARISAFNHAGPSLNAVRELSPHASDDATRADAAFAAGDDLGPLHGIPILLKDNILTGEGMTCTAGVAALSGFMPAREAHLVQSLRRAGAIVLGKTNMAELADYVSDTMPAGFSGAGGTVRNPHGTEYGRGQGSSVGSAAAVAAGFAPLAIGTETQNSIQTPACHSSVVGFKPSVGLVSRAGIVPLVPSQDSPGPLARCVADAKLVIAAMAGPDFADTITLNGYSWRRNDQPMTGLAGIRIGVPRVGITDRPGLDDAMPKFEAALSALGRAGATILDPCEIPTASAIGELRSSVFRTEFKAAIDRFFAEHEAPCGVDSLTTLIEFNRCHPERIPFGQSLLEAAVASGGVDDPVYRRDRARDLDLSLTNGLMAAFRAASLDLLIVPMSAAAKITGKAGAPVLALPLGLGRGGTPIGLTLIGLPGDDWRLLSIAAEIETVVGEANSARPVA